MIVDKLSCEEAIDSAMTRLCKATNTLNSETDRLNTYIATLDARLLTFNVGVQVWSEHTVKANDQEWQLGYARFDDAWHIAVLRCPSSPLNCAPLQLVKAPRLIRVCAVYALPNLLDALTARVGEITNQVKGVLNT